MNKLYQFHLKYKYYIFIVVIFFAILGIHNGKKLEVNLSLEKLLPDHSQSVLEMNQISEEIGGVGHLSVLIGPCDQPENLVKELAIKLESLKDIKYLFYKTEKYLLDDKVLYLLNDKDFRELNKNVRILFQKGDSGFLDLGLEGDEDKESNLNQAKNYFKNLSKNNTSDEYFLSKDKKYALLMIKPTFESVDLSRSELLNHQVADVAKNNLKGNPFKLLGRYVEKVQDTRQIEKDIKQTGVISLILIFIILLLGLGSFISTSIVIIGIALALGWTAGIAYFFVGQINILTGFLMAILAGLGADYGIHLIKRFQQEIKAGQSREEAMRICYDKTGRALFSSALSTAIAFLCLNISEFRGFSELGIIAGFGIISIFLVFMLCLPIFFLWIEDNILWPKITSLFGYFPFNFKHLKYFLFLVPFIVYGIFKTEFEYDFNRMRALSKESYDLKIMVDDLYGKSTSPVAIKASSKAEADAIVSFIEEGDYTSVIKESISLSSILNPQMKSRFKKIEKINSIISKISDEELSDKTSGNASQIRKWLERKPYSIDDLPIHLKNSFGKSGQIVLLFPLKQIDNKDDLNELALVLKNVKNEFPDAIIGSDTLVFNQIIDHIFEDGKIILLVFLLGIFITFMIDYKSVKSALILEAQIIFGILLMLGLMGLFEVRFTIMNIGIFPAILATGIDMGVHIRHHELESATSSLASSRLLSQAVHISILTTFIGFGSLLFAQAKILNGIAHLAIIGLLSMYIVCMVVRPLIRDYFSLNKKN